MRIVLRLVLLAAVFLPAVPFLLTSLLVDSKGITREGTIVAKDEWITVGYSSWTRHQQITVKYWPPDEPSLAILNADFVGDNQLFDRLHKGATVQLRYLLAQDGLHWPGIKAMRQMHVLPRARLQNQTAGSALTRLVWQARHELLAFSFAVILLLAWRLLRLPYFSWLFIICILTAVTWSVLASFPVPTPAPQAYVEQTSGTVKSIEVWKELFASSQHRTETRWLASEPIAVVGVEFTPKGQTDPVVAVDLIDAASMPALKEHSPVQVGYENGAPRIARIIGASRNFASKNLSGLLGQALLIAMVVGLLWCIALLFGKWYRNLIQSRR